MDETSIALLWGVLIGALAAASAVAFAWWVLLRRRPPAAPSVPRAEIVRLRLAQHWARGGLLSGESEPWRPACMAIAIAALGCRDLGELGIVLRTQVAAAGTDPQIANIFRQALAEHCDASTGQSWEIANSRDWPAESLLHCARALLEQAQAKAEMMSAARSVPPTAPGVVLGASPDD